MKLKIKGTNKQKSQQYPDITDQLDAIWKILDASNVIIPESAKEVFNKIQDTKKIFKKMKFQNRNNGENLNGNINR